MAHPKRRISTVDNDAKSNKNSIFKRSLEYAGEPIDIINRNFSRDTESNQTINRMYDGNSYNENMITENLIKSRYDKIRNKPDSIDPSNQTLTMQIFKNRQYSIPRSVFKGRKLTIGSK